MVNQIPSPTCVDPVGNCAECCRVFSDPSSREKFGYQDLVAECRCHDICVKDVRLICVKEITHVFRLPGVNGLTPGCRGGRIVTGAFPAECTNVRITCAEEELAENCRAVNNRIGLELVLEMAANPPVFFVVNTEINFACTTFWSFPDGLKVKGQALTDQLRFIDGSCKTIIIERCEVLNDTCPRVEVDLKIIDKLWKHENLLVSAIRPYPENITVKQEFNEFHRIGPCDEPPC